MNNNIINTWDFDGVVFMGWDKPGIRPNPNDVIITGRSFEELKETYEFLNDRDMKNVVYFNPLTFDKKTRESSGYHKAKTIKDLQSKGTKIFSHYDDDEIQIDIIRKECPDINVIHVKHNLIEKENVRHIKGE